MSFLRIGFSLSLVLRAVLSHSNVSCLECMEVGSGTLLCVGTQTGDVLVFEKKLPGLLQSPLALASDPAYAKMGACL